MSGGYLVALSWVTYPAYSNISANFKRLVVCSIYFTLYLYDFTMGTYLSKPITQKESLDRENAVLRCGASSMQGWRFSQEDAHNCILEYDKGKALFAVYDGHGGHEVAQYCSQNLPDYIQTTDAYKEGNMEKALIDGFLGFDATLTQQEVIEQLKEMAGSRKGDDDEDVAEEEEENVSNLCEEAHMPIEEVMDKYTSKSVRNLKKEGEPKSPYLKAKLGTEKEAGSSKDQTQSDAGCSSTVSKSMDKVKSHTPSDSSIILNGGESLTKNGTDKHEPQEDNEESKETNKDKTVTESNDKVPSILDDTPRKGSTDKGKAKMVKPERPKRKNDRQLYEKWLSSGADNESDSDAIEEDDDDDKTFESPHATSDDEENEASDDSSECNEEDGEDAEEEEDEEEEDDDELNEEDEQGLEFARNMKEEAGSDSGCTAVVALLDNNTLYVANAGDSRCVVCKNGKAIEMSIDHKPEDKPERDRVQNAGGRVTLDGRVNGGLNLSRAIGDHAYKQNEALSASEQMITALPDVRTIILDEDDYEFMVLACDGIWNFMSSQEVVDFIRLRLTKTDDKADEPFKLSQICEEMFDHCLAPDTSGDGTGCDNMTAIIVTFNSCTTLGTVCSRKRPASPTKSSPTTNDVLPDHKRPKIGDNLGNDDSEQRDTVSSC